MRKFDLYCYEIENVENYEKAKADNFKNWECHHRLETHTFDGERRKVDLSTEELITLCMYCHRPANELIFLTKAEHISLHNKGRKGWKNKKGKPSWIKGKHHSEETKKKISAAMKNKPTWNKGKHLSEDERKRLHWFNDGTKNIRAETCPDGFVPGRIK